MSTSATATIQTIVGGVGTAFIIYIGTIARLGLRKFMTEHRDLIQQTKQNTEDIKHNQEDIKRILHVLESRDDRRLRRWH